MGLNQSKCGILSVTRNLNSVYSSYHLKDDTPIKRANAQKDLGVIITSDLKWNQQCPWYVLKQTKCLASSKDRQWTFVTKNPPYTVQDNGAKSVIVFYAGLVTTVGITDSASCKCSTSRHKIHFIPTIHVRNIIQGQTFKN